MPREVPSRSSTSLQGSDPLPQGLQAGRSGEAVVQAQQGHRVHLVVAGGPASGLRADLAQRPIGFRQAELERVLAAERDLLLDARTSHLRNEVLRRGVRVGHAGALRDVRHLQAGEVEEHVPSSLLRNAAQHLRDVGVSTGARLQAGHVARASLRGPRGVHAMPMDAGDLDREREVLEFRKGCTSRSQNGVAVGQQRLVIPLQEESTMAASPVRVARRLRGEQHRILGHATSVRRA
mmetsp:Transcript_26613/g.76169  ORF Transcript_26613/g.76169 Transcript_26613/m.76169 type:complete len:236 (-) Transcript_26613:151-858(-)